MDSDGAAVAAERLIGEGALRSGAAQAGFVAGVRRPDGERL
ncbi:MAG: hypothetical protein QOH72_2063 [Solirubrobacteraceae bacterium]|nr:hypothetical protein [Solirubrobacteraceae bacterium]